ncbi:DUF3307 domain-containing protein [Phytohabitans sp. ZYX-F-186]|uniref:DUF3307 domain-containing protein n=1 Tax=Phytohabitans maris TaxID=3071409 RepID=A0ABU0ZUP2_9ACTN|nr:DUF3307 domain-containing protein [Phytohabitans sp. ZYX-F-186]MDQ7910217.1 DUF3307 domain-containing protein [Phytohabitans sp. ZYX-F-186]
MTHTQTATFAVVFVAFYAAHMVADHWVQTQWQADHKGHPGWIGRTACAAHVLTYTYTTLAAVGLAVWRLDLDLAYGNLAAGLAISAVSHYIADRRTPLRRIAKLTGSGRFYTLGTPRPGKDDNPSLGTGAYALDQSWHIGWLFLSALVVAG